MSKSAKRVFAAVVVGCAGLAFAASESSADTPPCTEASCGRYILCPATWQTVGSVAVNSPIYCRSEPQGRLPGCAMRNARQDWVFESAQKACCRGDSGNRTCSESNIICASDFPYDAAKGRCVGPPLYTKAKATTASEYGTYDYGNSTTVSGATDTLRCPAGYTLSFGTPTVPRYVCEKHESGQTSAAFCDGAGFIFNTTTKQCCRGTTCSTSNIMCQPGASYMSFKGSCVTPSKTVYAAPFFN